MRRKWISAISLRWSTVLRPAIPANLLANRPEGLIKPRLGGGVIPRSSDLLGQVCESSREPRGPGAILEAYSDLTRSAVDFGAPALLPRRPQLNLDETTAPPHDDVNCSIARRPRTDGVVIETRDVPAALSQAPHDCLDVLLRRKDRPAASDVLHPRELHLRYSGELVDDRWDALEPLRDDDWSALTVHEGPHAHRHAVQGVLKAVTKIEDETDRANEVVVVEIAACCDRGQPPLP